MKFSEEKLEKAFTVLLGQEGFPHLLLGIKLTSKPDEVLIVEDLQNQILSELKIFASLNYLQLKIRRVCR